MIFDAPGFRIFVIFMRVDTFDSECAHADLLVLRVRRPAQDPSSVITVRGFVHVFFIVVPAKVWMEVCGRFLVHIIISSFSPRQWKPSNISHQIMVHSPITHLKNLIDSTRNRVVCQRQTQRKQVNTMKTTGVPTQKLHFPTTDDGSSQSDYSDSTISSFDLRFARIQEVLSKRNAKDAEESRSSTTILGMEICTANHAK